MDNVIVKRKCTAISPDGERVDTFVGLRKPQKSEQQHWDCKLDFGALNFPERIAFGADEWQALQIGMHMMYVELNFKKMTGWNFYWFDGTTSDLEELWPYTSKNSSDLN